MLTVRMQGEDTAVVRLPQQVDYDNASLVGAECEALIRRGRTTLVIDASRVAHLDSSGISMLISLSRVLGESSGTLRLAAFNSYHQQVWHMLGLTTLFPLSPTVRTALEVTAADAPTGASEPSGRA
jgi:anti-sigma B factor antagonist